MPLQYWVTAQSDADWFLELGRKAADTIVQVLARRGLALTDLRTVLDFGCGAGRVMRHLARYESLELHGTDYNRTAVAWCDEHLPFAQFGTNRLQPPTRYRAAAFDLVYAFSVFTHLTEPLQRLWMEELRRILRRGGHLILSLHGEACLTRLAVAEQNSFRRGELVVISAEQAGQNGCGAYHPERYVRDVLAADFDVLEFVPRGALGNPPQDVYLLRRRES
jgi:SAM-dependent methyltransferase